MGSADFGGVLSTSFRRFAPCRVRRRWPCSFRFSYGPPSGSARAGAGVTLFTATILAVWSVVHGQGPFAEMSPTTTVPALTLSLIVVAAHGPDRSRRSSRNAARPRARSPSGSTSKNCSRVSPARSFRYRAIAWTRASTSGSAGSARSWTSNACASTRCRNPIRAQRSLRMDRIAASKSARRRASDADFPWSLNRLQQSLVGLGVVGDEICRRRRRTTLESMRRLGYEAMLILPIVSGDRALGALAFGFGSGTTWPDELVMKAASGGRSARQCPREEADRGRAPRQRGDEIVHPALVEKRRGGRRPRRPGAGAQRQLDAARAGKRRSGRQRRREPPRAEPDHAGAAAGAHWRSSTRACCRCFEDRATASATSTRRSPARTRAGGLPSSFRSTVPRVAPS